MRYKHLLKIDCLNCGSSREIFAAHNDGNSQNIYLAQHENGDIFIIGLKDNVLKRTCISEMMSQVILKKWNCKKNNLYNLVLRDCKGSLRNQIPTCSRQSVLIKDGLNGAS